MFKIALLLFLGWLAYRMIKAGRFVRGIMRTMEEAVAAAQEPLQQERDTAERSPDGAPRVTIHKKPGAGGQARGLEAEDARFRDV